MAYAGGWKKLEPMWDVLIRAKRATSMVPVLESVLSGFGEYRPSRPTDPRANRDVDDQTIASRLAGDERGSERAMKRREPTPLRTSGRTSGSEKPGKIEPPVEVSEVHSSPDAPRPRFIPLALSIDLGEVGPVGSLTTTIVQLDPLAPADPAEPADPVQPAAVRALPSSRRHLRLLPSP